jgi:hypothetical protein
MIASRAKGKWILFAALLAVAAVAFIVIERNGPRHPELGRIYQTRFNEKAEGFETITRPVVNFLFKDPAASVGTAGCMRLGQTFLLWSSASNTPTQKTGYLYFGEQPLKPKWEFAPSRHTSLMDVKPQDLDCEFYTKRDARGREVFGDTWRTNCLYVAEGQVLFARAISDPSVIYVIQFAQQRGGDRVNGSILIKYLRARTEKRPNSAAPGKGAMALLFQAVAEWRALPERRRSAERRVSPQKTTYGNIPNSTRNT